MKIRSLRKELTFIPEFNENKKLPDTEQIKIEIKSLPTLSEAQTYRTYRFSQDGATELVYNDTMMLVRHIGSIKNLEDDDGKILTGVDLSKSQNLALSSLVSEIRSYLLDSGDVLTKGE